MPIEVFRGQTFASRVQVLIIGAGACGTIAGLAATERGAEVLILERDAKPSGSTALSGGQIPAAGTRFQREVGLLDDTPDLLFQDIVNKAHGECDHAIARLMADESGNTVTWLIDRHQIPLAPVLDFQYPGHSRPHMHATPRRLGDELHTALLAAIDREGVPIATSAQVTDLFADGQGVIHGVRVQRPDGSIEEIGCDALILACNGYGGNRDMLARYIPEGADLFYEGHVGNQGDAVRWGEAMGASVRDMGSFQGHGAVAWPAATHLSWPTVTEGGFHVNRSGKRFSNENSGYSEQALHVHRQPEKFAWAIWDQRGETIAYRQESHVKAVESGCVKRCDSIADIARVTGCDLASLESTFAEVAACAAGTRADPFGRDFTRKPMLSAPYYVCRIVGALTHTQGGLEIDTGMRVLRTDGTPFPNLFAGGGAARGLSGPADWGYMSGSGLLMATSTGRLAGEAAARLVLGRG
ncbi:MAG: FAD-dependent oxidoreductase [Betaproteobacteria bacterium]|jgi:fumarate reductase flavoprotein subunit|nr:FAD-dependent oxidoreductase [Betaproteobacteria bacterium]